MAFKCDIFFFAVAPDKVTIEGPKEAKVNDSLHFKCETANSNPQASVQWVVDGRHAYTSLTNIVSTFSMFTCRCIPTSE